VIHTDFEKGFIRAETIAYDDFVALGGEAGAKDAGKMRDEGKEYVVKDGDVMHFRFNDDSDLIQLVRKGSPTKQTAIAKRPIVSRAVSMVISNEGAQEAIQALAGNNGAELSEADMETLLVRFPSDSVTAENLALRPVLPLNIAEKLVEAVSGKAFDYLVNHHALSPKTAIELAASARERASIDLIAQAGRTANLSAFAHHLNLAGRLTPSFILRAACLGYIGFVEHALAELSGVPHRKAWLLLHDAGPLGLRALYERTSLPARFMPIVRLAVDLYHEMEHEAGSMEKDAFSKIMVERILSQAQGLPREDVDYLLEKLDALNGAEFEPAEAARRIA
jgi:uncharacterized protein (DUF2336 family)